MSGTGPSPRAPATHVPAPRLRPPIKHCKFPRIPTFLSFLFFKKVITPVLQKIGSAFPLQSVPGRRVVLPGQMEIVLRPGAFKNWILGDRVAVAGEYLVPLSPDISSLDGGGDGCLVCLLHVNCYNQAVAALVHCRVCHGEILRPFEGRHDDLFGLASPDHDVATGRHPSTT